MIGTLLSYVPWWLYWVIAAIVLAATIPYWSAIWLGLPKWAKGAILAVAGLLTAWTMGRRQQRIEDEKKQKEADSKALQRRQEVRNEVSRLDDSAVDRRMRESGWMRDD